MNRFQRIDHFKKNLLYTAIATVIGSVALQAYGVTDEPIKRPDIADAVIIKPPTEETPKHAATAVVFVTKDKPKSVNLQGYPNLVTGLEGLKSTNFKVLDSGIEHALTADSDNRSITVHGPALVLSNSKSADAGEPPQYLKYIYSDVTGTAYNPKSALIFQESIITMSHCVGGGERDGAGKHQPNYFASVDVPADSKLHLQALPEPNSAEGIHAASISIKGEAFRLTPEGEKEAMKLHPSFQPCVTKDGKPAFRFDAKNYYPIPEDGFVGEINRDLFVTEDKNTNTFFTRTGSRW